ncbi:hypothetical protein PCANC_23294 [Puccinia coronata f. sp. avenae]|uniref:Uncharacterized protein n=1 Tax=Puccinia coronata f. sp. avenae TaxID=200324 RepID=A0A2N5TMU8_9BASI|nr:hypothetical protein PCANC_23294 [Puccinia coronata f. sp. avenae]PLW27577.1 hypothetical protein PCASD_20089 [Puccinia coronata f. sp. avenae]
MDCRLMAGVDLWRAKLPKVAAEGGIGPPPPSLAASVAAPLEDNYTLRAAKVHSRSRDGSSVGDALNDLPTRIHSGDVGMRWEQCAAVFQSTGSMVLNRRAFQYLFAKKDSFD